MVVYEVALAKTPLNENCVRYEETLVGHTVQVMEAFQRIFGTPEEPTRFAHGWLRFFKLEREQYETFYYNGITSCALHDIGKANNGTQDIFRRKGSQVVRHEHLAGLILGHK
jgi:hypothetical protein